MRGYGNPVGCSLVSSLGPRPVLEYETYCYYPYCELLVS